MKTKVSQALFTYPSFLASKTSTRRQYHWTPPILKMRLSTTFTTWMAYLNPRL